jgi:site-specific recombinase XerC
MAYNPLIGYVRPKCVGGFAAVQEIADWLAKRGTSEYVQCFAEVSLWCKPQLQQNATGDRDVLGPSRFNCVPCASHMLRHACGYALANKGHDTRALLQAYLGHRNIQHTVRYSELAPTRFKDFWRR